MKLKKLGVKQVVQNTSIDTQDTRELLNSKVCTIRSLLTTATNIQNKCQDFLVSDVPNSMIYREDGKLFFLDGSIPVSYNMSNYSRSQLCSKLGVPAGYIQNCISTGRTELASENVNSWLHTFDKDLLVRTYKDHVRGVLSDKYSILDTPEVLEVLKDTVDLNTYKVKESFLSEERMHLRLVGKEMLPIEGEDLFPGLFIDTSDVGRSILTVQFGVYKLVCTNGLVVSRGSGTLFKQKHIGISADEFHAGLVASLRNVDALCENMCQLVEDARQKSFNFNRYSQEDFEAFVKRLKDQTQLSNSGCDKVINLMTSKYGDTKWGMINSITEVAQKYTLERRLELERLSGNILIA